MEIKPKKGISLIVLVITIIVMIILATAIILSLNSSGIIGKANKAKEDTDISTIREVASIASAEYELEKADDTTTKTKKEYVEEYLNNQNLDLPEGYIINDEGQIEASNSSVSVWDGTVATSFASGTGTESDPYIIETASELAYLAQQCNISSSNVGGKYYKLTSDIDLNNISWTPIGTRAGSADFIGNFDGGNKKIWNLYIESDISNVGLFGFVHNCTIQNIIIESGSVTCLSTSSVYAGGIAGVQEEGGVITNCVNKASITSTEYTGGIIGYACYPSLITDCTNYGIINGVENNDAIIGGTQ